MAVSLRSKLWSAVWVAAVVLACTGGVQAQSFMATHAKVDLVAEQNTLDPGHTAWIGVLFDLEKGWHIYWVNPGDSGESPKFQWQLPTGFHAGEIRWPAPVRLSTGTVIDYGYEGRVLLPIPFDVPSTYKAGAPITLAADVRYLICRDVCIPAKTQVKLALPVTTGGAADAASRHSLFSATREHWPKPLPAGWKAQVIDAGKTFVLSLDTGTRETQAIFFPLDQDQIDNAAPQSVVPSGTGVRITLKKSDQLVKSIAALRGVVALSPDRAFEIAAPVAARR